MTTFARGKRFASPQCADALQRFLEHQAADTRQHQHVQYVDNGIDLAPALQDLEHTSGHQYGPHPKIDSLATHMGRDTRNARPGDLGGCRSGGDRGGYAIEN